METTLAAEITADIQRQRVETLRRRCLARKADSLPRGGDPRLMARSLRASAGVTSWTIRRGMLTRDLAAWLPLEIDEQELLIGRLAADHAEWQAEREQAEAYLSAHYPNLRTPGQTGHCELDLGLLFDVGINGLRRVIEERLASATGDAAETYQAFALALQGLRQLVENAAETARVARLDAETHGMDGRWRELDAIVGSCDRIASGPPQSFRDALQLLWLTLLGVQFADRASLVQPGHLDRTLLPTYRADVESGALTRDEALGLLECFYLLVNEFIPDGLAIGVMVGGRDAEGNDLTNDLSYLCLEALRRTRLSYPAVGICWHEGTPRDLCDVAVGLIAEGCPNPAFFGDETIQRGLRMYGVPSSESSHYVNSTCVEITPSGSSNVWVASPYFPVARLLMDEIATQVEENQVAETFDAFLARYQARLGTEIAAAVRRQNAFRETRRQYGGKPLQSLFTRDCLERGRDIDKGGARYNWVECSFVGLANLVDSLVVIRQEVFATRAISLPHLKAICDADYEGHEGTRLRFANRYPKYGNAQPEADDLVAQVMAFIQAECARHRMLPDDSPFVPGTFCWIQHERLGRECGATPDGRRAGTPFADGGGPAQGREKHGPTAAVLSTTSWDHAPLIGGLAYNCKFGMTLLQTRGARERLRDLIVTFLRRGGFETQVNVVDAEALRQARAHPERHRDLVVRIGGYTDYFVKLPSGMQDEIIARTEFASI